MGSYQFYRPDLVELAAAYEQYSVIVTTAELESPGPQILYVNSAFTRMTGYSIRELLGRTPRVLQGPKTSREVLDRLKHALSAGQDFIARAVNYKRDGTEFQIEWIINHLRDASGRTTHYVALQRDITGLERAQHDLERFDAELRVAGQTLLSTVQKLEGAESRLVQRERLAALGQMAAGVVHDLRNALWPIANFVEVLNAIEGLPPPAKRSIAGIGASAQHGLKLLANLASFHKSGEQSSLSNEVPLRSLLLRVPEILQAQIDHHAKRNGSTVTIDLKLNASPVVRGNAVELTQVLVNLVSNAIDAMPHGGVVTITLDQTDRTAIVAVSDTGTGLSADLIDRCFEPYVTTKTAGSGLGLSVCYGIIQRHLGRISARNAGLNGGAIFTIELPKVIVPESVDSTIPTAAQPKPSALKLLYIDDDQACRESTAALLSASGYAVTTASTGDEGLRLAHEHEYDAIITDTRMFPTTGIDVAMVLQRSRPQHIVILVSGMTIEDVELPDVLRHCERLLKPFTPADLATAIHRARQAARKPANLNASQ